MAQKITGYIKLQIPADQALLRGRINPITTTMEE